nr:MAG TPA: hypothetical protein [Caudoviricetes sp.]
MSSIELALNFYKYKAPKRVILFCSGSLSILTFVLL